MISKGTCHNNGVRLARYMTKGKDGERAELHELRGFAANDIVEAFRTIHVIAEATRCEKPFFHVQVRNREGETLTREQWLAVANRIESKLGLSGQPRAISFHVNERTGHEHMHLAISRIDEETMTAKELPYFKQRLKEVSRELELHFDLTPVRNKRDGQIKYAPTREQEEQARRLGVDIHEIRNAIRECWDRSDCGRSFEAALEQQGLHLAQGDRRAFVVIDREGGLHALGKRILDVSAAEVRDRLSDLDRAQMPTIQQVRERLRTIQAEAEKASQMWDRDAANQTWYDAVVQAALEQERQSRGGRKSEAGQGRDAGAEAQPPKEAEAGRARADNAAELIRAAYERSDNVVSFRAALKDLGIELARVTKPDAERSQAESAAAKAQGHWRPTYREGEILAVTERAQAFRLSRTTTGEKDHREIKKFLKGLDVPLPSLQEVQHQKQRQRDFEEMKARGRWAAGPTRAGMVEHHAWAMERVKAADEFRRKEAERRRHEDATKSSTAFDRDRYATDPDYRRQVRLTQEHKTPEERKLDRENELRALLEQQDRQR